MPVVSIIVPVYNAERYLNQCVDSILAQTFSDFELLLINDGSKDHSGEICDQYAQKDNRVKVFHLTNGGVSKARNYGLGKATGEFITFTDSDDWMEANTLETYTCNFSEEIDVVRIGFVREGSGKRTFSSQKVVTDDICTYFIKTEYNRYHAFVWNTMYRKSLLGDQRFDENISFCEDHLFSYDYYLKCKKFCILPNALYHYRAQNNSTLSNVQDATIRFKVAELDYFAKSRLNALHNEELQRLINDVYHRSVRKAIRTVYKNKKYNFEQRKQFWEAFKPATTDGIFLIEKIYASRKNFKWIDAYFQLIY